MAEEVSWWQRRSADGKGGQLMAKDWLMIKDWLRAKESLMNCSSSVVNETELSGQQN